MALNTLLFEVANKTDLQSAGQRQVSEEEGRKLAESWKASFVETSAKAGTNITRIFEFMLAQIEKQNGDQSPEKKAGECIIL